LISVRVVLKLQGLVASSEFDPYREKVAEEMLLCEIIVQQRICQKHYDEAAYEGAVQQDCEKLLSLARQLPTAFDIQAYYV
jgi:hypothetical protein